MRLAKHAVKAPATAVAAVLGDPDRGQQVVLKRGAKVPRPGGVLVIDASSYGPGLLGRVTASRRLRNGDTQLSLEPATLDQAYRQFDLRFNGSPAALVESPILVGGDTSAGAAARASANKLKAFSCKGPQIKRPDVLVDLTRLQVISEIDVQRRRVQFLISGQPVLRLRFEVKAGASCKLNENAKVFIPIVGPVGIDLAPVLEISAGGDSKLDFAMEPRIAVGFRRGTSSDRDFRVFNPLGGPTMNLHGVLGVNAFAGGSIAVSVGGRAGIRGKFGPALSLQATATSGQICGDVSGALRVGLDVYANVFIADLTFRIAQGDFLHRSLFSRCVGSGTGSDGGDGNGDGSPGGGKPGGPGDETDGQKYDDSPYTGPPPEPTVSAFPRLSVARDYGCGIRSGTVECFGGSSWTPVPEPAGDFKQVSVGRAALACGIRQAGTVACWGSGEVPSPVPAGDHLHVSAGSRNACAVRWNYVVECWGTDDRGQSSPPAGRYTQVSAAGSSTPSCGIRTDGTLACWGTWLHSGEEHGPPEGIFRQVSVGQSEICAMRPSGTVECWGEFQDEPTIHDDDLYTRIDTGSGAVCGLREDDHSAECFTPVNSYNPLLVGTSRSGPFESVSAGSHACAQTPGGEIQCWGGSYQGQVALPAGSFTQIDAGSLSTCGVRADGTGVCWGEDEGPQVKTLSGSFTKLVGTGSLGHGLRACGLLVDETIRCEGPGAGATPLSGALRDVAVTESAVCGVKDDGSLACWRDPSLPSLELPSGSFMGVSGAGRYGDGFCGLREDGAIACWNTSPYLSIPPGTFESFGVHEAYLCGIRSNGALACAGIPPYVDGSPPSGTFKSVAVGLHHACAIRSSGALACWGEDNFEQASPPTGTFQAVTAGDQHSCAIRDNGEVTCWGDATY